jgi:hypothetical protein
MGGPGAARASTGEQMTIVKEITFEIWRSSEKRCYYLMSSAGAGIGYSLVTLTENQTAADLRMMVAALVCWAISFLFGIRTLGRLNALMGFSKNISGGNAGLSQLRQIAPNQTHELLDGEAESLGSRTSSAQTMQLTLLIGGALLLILSRIDVDVFLGLPSS